MSDCILTVNGGSSSIKFALFEPQQGMTRRLYGSIDRIGLPAASFTVQGEEQTDNFSRPVAVPDFLAAVTVFIDWLGESTGRISLAAIGHRIVHGGWKYRETQRITPRMLEELRELSPFDPEHLPQEVLLAEALQRHFPNVTQIACFDTDFHRDLPRVARLLPIPRRYETQGVQRYGFHGLSYAYLMQEFERLAGSKATTARVILAHLGNGASMAAVSGGRSIDTTMAFTPAAGLVMSTRCGDLDPGLAEFFARSEQMTAAQFNHMINHESGLLGVSETSSDMRDLLLRETTDVRAAEAVALFCYQAKKWVGAYAAVLGGLDTLIFTGGIGENAPAVRARICAGLDFLGIELSDSRNAADAAVISTDASRATVRVIRTDEELMIARSVSQMLGVAAPGQRDLEANQTRHSE